jgi:hypothetical protein
MSHSSRRRLLLLVAIYAVLLFIWAWLAYWVVPAIIVAACDERSSSTLKWVFQGHRSPVRHYINLWSVISTAVPIAAIFHFAIVGFIEAIDRKNQILFPDTARTGTDSRANVVLIVFSAVFLAATILSGIHGDYDAFIQEWDAILAGRDPWLIAPHIHINAYGPLFNVLAPFVWVNPLANKLLFASAYLAFVIWLIKDFGARRGLSVLSWPVVVFWLINPFPWVEIAYYGQFDVIVAVACVAAVHGQVRGRDVFSGACLAIGVLLKYLPIVILPFLVFGQGRFRIRLLISCAALVISGLAVSVLVWGTSTFLPLTLAAVRGQDSSIYRLLASAQWWIRPFWDLPNLDRLKLPVLATSGIAVFAWCMARRTSPALSSALAILVTLLAYWVGFINYQMVFFCLISYWAVSEWTQIRELPLLTATLIGYFGVLASLDIAVWLGIEDYGSASTASILLKFLMGCAVLARLLQFSARQTSP